MGVKVFLVNAFAKTAEGGNPAGVVLDADGFQEDDMKKIAKIIGFSETAFVSQSEVADFKVRFFTPEEEVDLCGHATIATFSTLAEQGRISSGIYTQETRAGVLPVEVKRDGTVMMNQNKPQFLEVINKSSEVIVELETQEKSDVGVKVGGKAIFIKIVDVDLI